MTQRAPILRIVVVGWTFDAANREVATRISATALTPHPRWDSESLVFRPAPVSLRGLHAANTLLMVHIAGGRLYLATMGPRVYRLLGIGPGFRSIVIDP